MMLELVLAFVTLAAPARSDAKQGTIVASTKKELKRRTLRITDASSNAVHEISVAMGSPTTLVFAVPLKDDGVLLADVQRRFYPPQVADRSVILVPKSALKRGEVTSLSITLEDGTLIPFKLVAARRDVDLQVDVDVALDKKATPDSPQGLRTQLNQVRAQLDECEASAGTAGMVKIGSLILAQDSNKPQSNVVERRDLRHLDKQSRLLVETRQLYRIFGQGYLVLTLENRDPSRSWVLDRAELATRSGNQSTEARVVQTVFEPASLPPGEIGKYVIIFDAPEQGTNSPFTIELFEKAGDRHVKLEGVRL